MITTQAILKQKRTNPSGSTSFVIFQPEETFSFLEGQFCMIEALLPSGSVVKKPYSIATTHRMLLEEKEIGFIVKNVRQGGMSEFLSTILEIGASVALKGPIGHYCDPQNHASYLLISAGSGLSPNFGLFTHLAFESQRPVSLINIYGEKHEEDMIPFVFEHFTAPNIHQVTNYFCLSQQTNCVPPYYAGRVQICIPEAIQILGTQTTCFVCGSPQAVGEIVTLLLTLGISKDDIITEKR